MSRVYLFAYSDSLGTREKIKDTLNRIDAIKTWRYDIPHTFYLVSNLNARELTDLIRGVIPNNGRFIISEITENRQGWLPKDTWYFLRNKRPKPSGGT